MLRRIRSLQATLLLHEISFILLLLISLAAASAWSVSWLKSSEESLRLSSMNSATQNVRSNLYRQLKEVFDASFLNDKDAIDEYQFYTKAIKTDLANLSSLATQADERLAISEISEAYIAFYDETINLFDNEQLDGQRLQLLDYGLETHTFSRLETRFKNLETSLFEKQKKVAESREYWTKTLSWLMLIPVILSVALLVFARQYVQSKIVRPLLRVIAGARRISKGELNHTIPVTGGPELSQLSKSMNEMTAELASNRDILAETKKQAEMASLIPLVAHNIRNPLAGIRAASQVAKDEELSEYTRDTLDDIILAVDRLEKWVSSLLSYLHPVKPHLSEVSLIQIADNALSLIELQLINKHITIERKGWIEQPVNLSIDIHLLEQAVFNLIQNSLEASHSGQVITLEYSEMVENVVLKIRDQGQGMTFDPLTESVLSGDNKRFSCGLGVPFALKVIKQHHGSLKYTSSEPYGTEVTIVLAR